MADCGLGRIAELVGLERIAGYTLDFLQCKDPSLPDTSQEPNACHPEQSGGHLARCPLVRNRGSAVVI
eukprot:7515110-Alexandrium_andersonii.AAC.1